MHLKTLELQGIDVYGKHTPLGEVVETPTMRISDELTNVGLDSRSVDGDTQESAQALAENMIKYTTEYMTSEHAKKFLVETITSRLAQEGKEISNEDVMTIVDMSLTALSTVPVFIVNAN